MGLTRKLIGLTRVLIGVRRLLIKALIGLGRALIGLRRWRAKSCELLLKMTAIHVDKKGKLDLLKHDQVRLAHLLFCRTVLTRW